MQDSVFGFFRLLLLSLEHVWPIHVATNSGITKVTKLAVPDYKLFCIVSLDTHEFPKNSCCKNYSEGFTLLMSNH